MDSRWEHVTTVGANGQSYQSKRAKEGARFEDVTVLCSEPTKKGRTTVKCDCGQEFTIDTRALWRGQVHACVSCSMVSARKLSSIQRGYDIIEDLALRYRWLRARTGIISRCYNPKCKAYKNYGARGLYLYEEWKDSPRKWLEYAVTLPEWDNPALEVDRIDNHGSYVPGNLHMVTRKQNTNNRRSNRILTYNGQAFTYQQFREAFMPLWSQNTLAYHLDQGKTLDQILEYYRRTA